MKLSVCLEFVYQDLPIEQRIARVKELGFDAGEIWHWRDRDLEALRKEAERHEFRIISLCATEPQVGFTDRARSGAVIKMVEEAMEAAAFLGCSAVILMAGPTIPALSRHEQVASIVDGLSAVKNAAASRGIMLLLEALNSRECKGYFLDNSRELLDIVRAVNHPSVRALFDLYHLGIMEGNILETIQTNLDLIGRFQIAGIPGRHEPEFGELNYPAICGTIERAGFDDFIGLEYIPTLESSQSLTRTLGWLRGERPSAMTTPVSLDNAHAERLQ
jgi:hydroxypyruvate isomerase